LGYCTGKNNFWAGEGKTKQAAKKQAARLLFEKIKNLSPEEKAVLNYNEFQTPSEVLLNGDQLNNVDGKISPSEALKCVNKFKNQLKLSNNPSINKLKVNHKIYFDDTE